MGNAFKNSQGSLTYPVGDVYIQMPWMKTPQEMGRPGVWLNISQRAEGYGISEVNESDPTSYISRDEAGQLMDFSEDDLAIGDTISAGAYSGKFIRSVESMAGDFLRFEGGEASEFEGGEQNHQLQGHAHSQVYSTSGTGGSGYGVGGLNGASGHSTMNIKTTYPQGTYEGTEGTVHYGNETRPVNRTIKKWRRTA